MDSAGATLDIAAIRRAQRANALSVLKRERESREARQALSVARAEEVRAREACDEANATAQAAQRDHARAVAACHSAVQDGVAMARGELLLRFKYCERLARVVVERLSAVDSAAQDLREQQAQVKDKAQAYARAEQRLAQAREQTASWRQREQLAIELHADLALEDEPRRTRAA
jgi:hypothetical protein